MHVYYINTRDMCTYVHTYVFITHKHIYLHIDIHFHTYVEYKTWIIRFVFTYTTIGVFRMIWRTVIFRTTGRASWGNINSVTVCGSREALFAVTTWPATEWKQALYCCTCRWHCQNTELKMWDKFRAKFFFECPALFQALYCITCRWHCQNTELKMWKKFRAKIFFESPALFQALYCSTCR